MPDPAKTAVTGEQLRSALPRSSSGLEEGPAPQSSSAEADCSEQHSVSQCRSHICSSTTVVYHCITAVPVSSIFWHTATYTPGTYSELQVVCELF